MLQAEGTQLLIGKYDYCLNLAPKGEEPRLVYYPIPWVKEFLKLYHEVEPKCIFVEGPACAGKSSMMKFLSGLIGASPYKTWGSCRPIPPYSFMDMTQSCIFVMDYIRQVPGVSVWDRSFASILTFWGWNFEGREDNPQHRTEKRKLFCELAKEIKSMFVFIDIDFEDAMKHADHNEWDKRIISSGLSVEEEIKRQIGNFRLLQATVEEAWDIPTIVFDRRK